MCVVRPFRRWHYFDSSFVTSLDLTEWEREHERRSRVGSAANPQQMCEKSPVTIAHSTWHLRPEKRRDP